MLLERLTGHFGLHAPSSGRTNWACSTEICKQTFASFPFATQRVVPIDLIRTDRGEL